MVRFRFAEKHRSRTIETQSQKHTKRFGEGEAAPR